MKKGRNLPPFVVHFGFPPIVLFAFSATTTEARRKDEKFILQRWQHGSQRPRKKFCIKITPNGFIPLSVISFYSNRAQKFFPFTSAFLCATDQNPKRQINRFGHSDFLALSMEFTADGLPAFGLPLAERAVAYLAENDALLREEERGACRYGRGIRLSAEK